MISDFLTKLFNNYTKQVTVFGIVVFGAITGALYKHQKAKQNSEPLTIAEMFIEAFLSIFAGIMFGVTAEAVSAYLEMDNKYVIYACAGFGAYVGVNGLNELYDLIKGGATKIMGGKNK